MRKQTELYQSFIGKANYYVFLLFIISLPFPWRLSHTIFLIWFVLWVLELRFLRKDNLNNITPPSFNKPRQPWMIFTGISLFVVYEMVSSLWSIDSQLSWHLIERHLLFFALPLIALFGLNDNYNSKNIVLTLIGTSTISVLIYLFGLYYAENATFLMYNIGEIRPFEIPKSDGLTVHIKHRLFYCTILIASLCFIPHAWQKNKSAANILHNIILIFSVIIILTGIYMTYSRASILTICCLLPLSLLIFTKGRTKIIATVISIVVTVIIAGVFVKFHPRMQNLQTDNPRQVIWQVAANHLKEIPFYGLGTGTEQQFMIEAYTADQCPYGANEQFFPHNQYLSTYIELGWIGIVMLLCLMVMFPLHFSGHTKKYAVLSVLLYALNMLTDDILERIDPLLTLYAVAIILAIMQQEENTKSSITVNSHTTTAISNSMS